jgi:hypothetical protein
MLASGAFLLLTVVDILSASQQGLWSVTAPAGQLQRIDWTTGDTTDVGQPLSSESWEVPSCSPSTIDQTGKWYYQYARPSHSSAGTPWSLLVFRLQSRLILYVQEMAPSFPVHLDPCDYMVVADGGWGAYVASVKDDNHLVVMYYGWEQTLDSPTRIKVIWDAVVPSLLGGGATYPSCALSQDLLWLQFSNAIGVLNMTDAGSPTLQVAIRLNSDEVLSALQYDDQTDSVFGLLSRRDSATVVASFPRESVDAKPAVGNVTMPDADNTDSLASFLFQPREFALEIGSSLATFSLNGTKINEVPISSISSMHYEPFVFAAIV